MRSGTEQRHHRVTIPFMRSDGLTHRIRPLLAPNLRAPAAVRLALDWHLCSPALTKPVKIDDPPGMGDDFRAPPDGFVIREQTRCLI